MVFATTTIALLMAILFDPIHHTPLSREVQYKFLADISATRPLVYFELATRIDKLIIPADLVAAYATNPRGTAAFLYRVSRDGKPLESVTACGYAIGLLNDPSLAVICSQVYKGGTNYDQIDADWGRSPRDHWLRRIRADMITTLPPIKPD